MADATLFVDSLEKQGLRDTFSFDRSANSSRPMNKIHFGLNIVKSLKTLWPIMERQTKLLLLAVFLIFVGLLCTLIAIFTPAWQVGFVERMNETIENGLWIHCESSPLVGKGCVSLLESSPSSANAHSLTDFLHRSEKEIDSKLDSSRNTFPFIDRTGVPLSTFDSKNAHFPLFFGFNQEAVLALYFIAVIAGFWAAFAGCLAIFRKSKIFAILLDVFVCLSIVISMSAIVLFLKTSQPIGVYIIQIKNRYNEEIRGTYNRTKGFSFYLELIGTICWFIAIIPGVIGTRSVLSKKENRTWNSEHYVKIRHVRNSSYDKALNLLDSRSPTRSYVSIATSAAETAETASILTRSASVPGIQAEHTKTVAKSKNSKLAQNDEIDWRSSSRTVGW